MKNGKNGHSSQKMHPRVKLSITDPTKVWVSGFLNVNRNGKLVMAILKNRNNGFSFQKMHPRVKLPITVPPKVRVSGFPNVDGNGKLVSAITEDGKMAIAPQKCILEQNFQLLTLLKFGSLVFQVSTEMENWCQPLRKMRKWLLLSKNASQSKNSQLPTP